MSKRLLGSPSANPCSASCSFFWPSEPTAGTQKSRALARYLWVVLFFGLGITAKVMVIPFPFALLLLDYWPLARLPGTDAQGKPLAFFAAFRALVIEKIPLFLMAAAGGAITVYVHSREHALTASMPFAWRFKNAIFSYVAYLAKAIWPVGLAPYYPHPENTLAWTIVALARPRFNCYHRHRLAIPPTQIPADGLALVSRNDVADDRLYPDRPPRNGRPLHAHSYDGLVVCSGLARLADFAEEKHWQKEIAIAIFLLALAPYAAVTIKQIGYWHDSYTLFGRTLEVTKNNGFAENDFGVALMERGEPDLAAPHFLAAVRLSPDLASPHYNLAVLLQKHNQLNDAEHEYRAALALSSDQAEIVQSHNNLGCSLSRRKQI